MRANARCVMRSFGGSSRSGRRSAAGSRFVETMLTVIETCRQQRRNAFVFLTDAVRAILPISQSLHYSPDCERLPRTAGDRSPSHGGRFGEPGRCAILPLLDPTTSTRYIGGALVEH